MILFYFILFLVISEMINDVWIFEQKKVIHDVCAAVATTPVQTSSTANLGLACRRCSRRQYKCFRFVSYFATSTTTSTMVKRLHRSVY